MIVNLWVDRSTHAFGILFWRIGFVGPTVDKRGFGAAESFLVWR